MSTYKVKQSLLNPLFAGSEVHEMQVAYSIQRIDAALRRGVAEGLRPRPKSSLLSTCTTYDPTAAQACQRRLRYRRPVIYAQPLANSQGCGRAGSAAIDCRSEQHSLQVRAYGRKSLRAACC